MTKREMINELYKKIYKLRYEQGYYLEGSAAWREEHAECFKVDLEYAEVKLTILEALAQEWHVRPNLRAWYGKAFHDGFKAISLSECIVPDNLIDMT